ncbi:hypothetical protein P886_1760 [Alteromonadaceae bacterium 2753L.S.0a.02]|nr:hypothetical protein P886_1760 [Alteromonadaceae bacterium 2753L.S.0a.02]
MIRKIFLLFVIILSVNAHGKDCPPEKIKYVQVERDKVLVFLENQNWHLLGFYNVDGTKEMYSAVLAAHMADKNVSIRYPEGYDCSAYELSIGAHMVRVYPE